MHLLLLDLEKKPENISPAICDQIEKERGYKGYFWKL